MRDIVGWREVGQFFSLSDPCLYPRDPAVTAAIRTFDPDMIPMWVSWVFLPDVKDAASHRPLVVGRHAIGHYSAFRPDEFHSTPILVPPNYFGPIPNHLDLILENGPGERPDAPLPGPFEPWDWKLYYKLRLMYARKTGKEAVADLREQQYRKQLRREKNQAALQQFQREMSRDAEKMLESMGGDVYQQFAAWKTSLRSPKRIYSK
jgi:hypothetical protein